MKRHSTDLTSLIFGGIFLSIAAWWLISHYIHITVPNFGWFAAGALIVIGALGIAGSLRGERNREPVADAPVSGGTTASWPTSSSSATQSGGPTTSSGSSFSSFPGGTPSSPSPSATDDDTLA